VLSLDESITLNSLNENEINNRAMYDKKPSNTDDSYLTEKENLSFNETALLDQLKDGHENLRQMEHLGNKIACCIRGKTKPTGG
jgi:hypothetical protein